MSIEIKFLRKIRGGGGSLTVAIPPQIAQAMNFKEGDDIQIYVSKGKTIIEKGD